MLYVSAEWEKDLTLIINSSYAQEVLEKQNVLDKHGTVCKSKILNDMRSLTGLKYLILK